MEVHLWSIFEMHFLIIIFWYNKGVSFAMHFYMYLVHPEKHIKNIEKEKLSFQCIHSHSMRWIK